MKNKIIILVLILCLTTVSLFATVKEWKRTIINQGIPVYADRTKTKSSNYLHQDEPFYIKKAGELWEVKRETYPVVYGFIDLNDPKGNENKKPYHIDHIAEDADYIDILVFKIKKYGITNTAMHMTPPVKIIDFLEKILRKNQNDMNTSIPIQLSKKDLIYITHGIKPMLDRLGGSYSVDLKYTRNNVDAYKVLVYMRSLIDINNILNEETHTECYYNIAMAYKFLGDTPKELMYLKLTKMYESVIDIYVSLGNTNGVVKYSKIVVDETKKRNLVKKKDEPHQVFDILSTYEYDYTYVIKALIQQKEYDEALKLTKELYTLYKDNEKLFFAFGERINGWSFPPLNDKALYLQAQIYKKQLKMDKSLAALNKILDIYKTTHPSRDKYFELFQNVAEYYYDNKVYRESIRYNLKAIDVIGGKNGLSLDFTIYNKIIDAALKLGTKESDEVIKKVSYALYDSVLKQSKLKRHQMSFVALEMAGDMFLRLGKYKEANFAYLIIKNNNWDNEGEGRAEFSPIYLKLASVKRKEGDLAKALSYTQEALEEKINFYGNKHTDTGIIYDNLTQLYLEDEKYLEAYTYAQLSFNIFLNNRDHIFTLFTQKGKEKYLKSNLNKIKLYLKSSSQYLTTIDTNKKSVKENDVLFSTIDAWFNYKGSIFDSENAIAILHAKTKDEVLKSKIDDLILSKRQLAKLYQTLPKPKERDNWKNRVKEIEEKIAVLTNAISTKASDFKEQEGLKSIHYKDISSKVKNNELYIDYAKVGGHYYIFSLDNKENITFTEIDVNSTKQIDFLVKSFREDVTSILSDNNLSNEELEQLTTESKEKLSILYDLLLKDLLVQKLQDKTNLIISPDGALKLLPFEAMYDKKTNKYLIEEKEIRYVPSGKELVRLYRYANTEADKENNTTVIFSNPDYNANLNNTNPINQEDMPITPSTSRAGIIKSLFRMRFAPLPGTKAEAASIRSTLKNEKLTEYKEEQASEVNLMKVKEPKILHIATHGFFINDSTIPNPMLKSGIALSGANKSVIKGKSDGVVTALKLSGLELKGTDLVVLSACQTGVVDINSTDSVSGLSKAFIQAGAKDIVMSLWSVNDEATKDLMSSFYQEMQNHSSYSNALKEAKLKMIEKDIHPFYWAPFVLNGI